MQAKRNDTSRQLFEETHPERVSLLNELETYHGTDQAEESMRLSMIRFLKESPDCFEHSSWTGHFTGSAWVTDPTHSMVLLNHHRKLGAWFQLGGHADGNTDLLKVASKEAWEESGLMSLLPLQKEIFDVDIHEIPAHGEHPNHTHYDVRYFFIANRSEHILTSMESFALRWVALDDVKNFNDSESIMRMVAKTKILQEKKSKQEVRVKFAKFKH